MVDSSGSGAKGLLAAACFLAILGSLCLPYAAFQSMERGIVVWILSCLGSGIVASNIEPLNVRMASSAQFSLIKHGYFTHRLLCRTVDCDSSEIGSCRDNPHSFRVRCRRLFHPRLMPVLLVLLFLVVLATSIVIAVAMLAGKTILSAISSAYSFGPEGLLRIRRMLVACTSIVTAALALWAAVG